MRASCKDIEDITSENESKNDQDKEKDVGNLDTFEILEAKDDSMQRSNLKA